MYHLIIISLISPNPNRSFHSVFTYSPDPVEELFLCPTPYSSVLIGSHSPAHSFFFFLGESTSIMVRSFPPSVINVYCFIIIIYLPMMLSAQTVVLERFT